MSDVIVGSKLLMILNLYQLTARIVKSLSSCKASALLDLCLIIGFLSDSAVNPTCCKHLYHK